MQGLVKSRMRNGETGLEFLRFGSSIPGSYWGCCACDIIQNFKVYPDTKASIEIVGGDGGQAVGDMFAGPTYKDIFLQRIRFGTFGSTDMPNHAFIAILTEWQIASDLGKKWLAILKEAGFEFIRTVNNSVYSGASMGEPKTAVSNNDNHIFMLIRNIGSNALKDQFTPPKAWSALPDNGKVQLIDVLVKAMGGTAGVDLTKANHAADRKIWDKIGKAKLLTRKQVEKAGVPVMLAGKRSEFPQEKAESRDAYIKTQETARRGLVDAIFKAAGVTPNEAQKTAAYTAAGLTVAADPFGKAKAATAKTVTAV